LDSSDTRQQGGTGLGLAISKSLIEQHSGTIGFCNEEKGCTFWFELPASDCTLLRTDSSIPNDASSSAPHVLIVEDDEQLAYVMAAQLKVIGCSVTVVGDVASGTRFLAEQKPDLMLLDLLLPDGNGTEIVEYLESLAPKDRVPIVIVSGLADSETNCRSRSIVEWVQKPFQIDDLLQVVQRATSTFAPATVAVIDDDDLLRQVIDVQLSRAGIRCLHAADGLEALELIENHTLDLLILDLSMPRLDGHNLIEVLRRAKCETPLLLYSGQELSCVQVNHLQLGPTMSLTKGRSSQDDFLKAVFTLLKNRSAVSAGESNFKCA